MFWCDTCGCAYSHGPEGPAAALRTHTAQMHGDPADGRKPITGRQVVIGFAALVAAAYVADLAGYSLT